MSLPLDIPDVPTAIAFSGGGDSTAMVHAFAKHPNVTHAFIIDHALRPESASEAAQVADWARGLGYTVEVDRWAHHGIRSGVQVKARVYRYAALGRMCRAAGLTQLLTAHTADDQAETLLMRLDRRTGWRGLAGMPASAHAPLWPALWNVDLVRPWLGVSRAELRAHNAAQGLSFIDDPSNENRDFTRIRARQALAADTDLRRDLLSQQAQMRTRLESERAEQGDWLRAHARISEQGFIRLDAVPDPELLLHLLRAASGTGGPIDRAKRRTLIQNMATPDFKAATLAGAWVVRTDDGFVITRDMVAVTGRGGQAAALSEPLPLPKGTAVLWDGRFSIQAHLTGLQVLPASYNFSILLQETENEHFLDYQKSVQPTLPVFWLAIHPLAFGAHDSEILRATATTARRLQALFGPQSRSGPAPYET